MDMNYTAHHNWQWVVEIAMNKKYQKEEEITGIYHCKLFSELPSQKRQKRIEKIKSKLKIQYALFRVEIQQISQKIKDDIQRDTQQYDNLPNKQLSLINSIWATSCAFAFIDSKDALYRCLKNENVEHLMPKTLLLSFDTDSTNDIELPSTPSILKAALGSGGFGLYFVYNKEDVLSIIRSHFARANSFSGFIDSLKTDYGEVPAWSLQSLLSSYRTSNNDNNNSSNQENINIDQQSDGKRCQIRVYVIYLNNHCYMYNTFESRMPSWNVNLDAILSTSTSTTSSTRFPTSSSSLRTVTIPVTFTDSNNIIDNNNENNEDEKIGFLKDTTKEKTLSIEEFETFCCSNTTARPYNKDRNKSSTERYIFDEIKELSIGKESIRNCVITAMIALKSQILNQTKKDRNNGNSNTNTNDNDSNNINRNEIAIAGIDLMLEISNCTDSNTTSGSTQISTPVLTSYILEVNHNPAMPGENKKMSDSYRKHLIFFVESLIRLGLSDQKSIDGDEDVDKKRMEGFELIW